MSIRRKEPVAELVGISAMEGPPPTDLVDVWIAAVGRPDWRADALALRFPAGTRFVMTPEGHVEALSESEYVDKWEDAVVSARGAIV